ncbi:protein lethal(2)essential for life-like [Helicoverpa zea]|uniref:protein lethal(2)essential for life-like n=1 Tax=Helicoverpa zea TaxID=7113 RepID=UPI001F5A6F8C|nr:protein lethal(2)essential for life-like [Helicoverpa zea]
MSLLPFLLGTAPHRLADQEFGLGISPDDLLTAVVAPMVARDYYRPWRQMAVAARDIGSTIVSNKEKFQVNLDVQHFAPEEISVKTSDGYVIVEGKHEEKRDEHGYISRQFTRRYILPENCDPATVESKLSSDGVLSIIAPKTPPLSKNERSVPISQTGPVRKEIKDAASQPTAQTDANGTAK